ncbi:hypothetical protein SAMN05443637_103325 [Pseudonocardia thermophila]|jgi:hypothetical protein|uniref:Uncharacterized protein n=2 Tax=Pseudonocardia thermophila TaxID=1848 RepID=A0A1M6QHB3_PSETH|nr:hypothetical protein [Pseudonocardia thermophila]SHK19632.1 hypothetical protein SAMN05443637_103325 [Pseudonocardia thermophila]
MVVTGFDDRSGCGYVLATGPDVASADAGTQRVTHDGVTITATPELAAGLRDALLAGRSAQLVLGGPPVPLNLDDRTLLGWLRFCVGGVLSVMNGPE